MSKGNHIRPQRQLVHERVGDVVGCVEADDGGEERPGSECAG